MLNQFQYVNEKKEGYFFELNDKGRAAKKAGGHFAYLKILEDKKVLETKRELINEGKDKYDLLTKKWIYNTRLLPYVVSIIALVFSILQY